MLGLADQSRVTGLLAAVLRGQAGEALDLFGELYALGADPAAVLLDLLDLTHRLSRLKAKDGDNDPTLDPAARSLVAELSMGSLSRAWALLLRGSEEIGSAPDAGAAAEMILLRLATAAELPPPGELMRLLRGQPDTPAAERQTAPAPTRGGASLALAVAEAADAMPPAEPGTFADLVGLLGRSDEKMLAAWLYEGTHLVRFEPGVLEFRPRPGLPPDMPSRLNAALHRLTGRRWMVAVANAGGEETLAAQAEAAKTRRIAELGTEPGMRQVLDLFPGARIVDVRPSSDNN
jgi:DNA polymerase-3 subunit gamma/tau